jgi:nitrate/nitrite-specific signal transduction histidine kinase
MSADRRRPLGIRWGGLRSKIIAWSFVPTAIILGTVALVTYMAYQQVTEDLVIERNRELTRLSADQLRAALNEYTNLLVAEARRSEYKTKDPVIWRAALHVASQRLSVFDGGLVLLDEFGFVVAAEPDRSEIIPQDWADREYYRQVLSSDSMASVGPALSNIVADGPGNTDAIAMAVPVAGDSGEFIGLLIGMFRIDAESGNALYGNLLKLRIGKDGNAYVVDNNGRLIYHADSERISEDVSDQEVVQQALGGETGAIRTRDFEGRDIVASYAPIPGTPWSLVAEESWTALIRASQQYREFLILLLALGVVVPALVVAVGVRRLTTPINDLIRASREVAGGHLGQTIRAQTGDEIEELADQFNQMSIQLQESYANLEQRVAIRTRELAALNAIATVVSQSLDLDEILDGALDTTLQVMDIEVGGIYLLDETAGLLDITTQRGLSPEFVAGVNRLKVGEGFSGRVVQSGQPLVVSDVSSDHRLTRMVVREEGLRSLAVVPIDSKGKALGTLFTMSHGYRDFTDQDVQLLSSIGHQIGIAVESSNLFQAVQRRAEQFRVITEVSHRITSILDIDEVLVEVVHLIQQSFDYDHVAIALVEGDEAVYRVGAGDLWDNPDFEFRPERLKVGEEGITGWVAATGEPLLVPDVSQEPRYVWMQGSTTRSELAVPIKLKGKVIGVLDVQSERLRAFDESDLTVIQSLASQAAIAIENARLFNAEQRRAEQFRVISEVGRRMTSILDIDALLEEIVTLIRETFGYYLVDIALIENDDLVVRAGAGYRFGELGFQPPLLQVSGKGIMAWVARTGKPLLAPDVRQEPRYVSLQDNLQTQSEVAVPLKTKTATIGVLDVQSDRPNAFDESDLAVLQSLANQAAVAIENAQLYEQARQLAVIQERQRLARELHDAVTQTLFSASLIAEALPELWESDQGEGRELLGELRQLSRGALAEMRTLLLELRPASLIEARLEDLLRQLGEAATGRTGALVHISIEGQQELPPDVHVTLYRIAQEALNNVVKHSRASKVQVELHLDFIPADGSRGDTLAPEHLGSRHAELQVRDDGSGFDPTSIPSDRLGLGIIRERADAIGADLRIVSQPGHGTQISVTWQEPTPLTDIDG